MATQQVVLTQPLSADRAVLLGLDVRDYAIGEQVVVDQRAADQLRRAGYLAPLGTTGSTGGGSGVSSLTVYDSGGSALPQRSKIQFSGSVTVADDAINSRTVVTATGSSGGGGAVASVNGRTGAVVIGAADVGALTRTTADTLYAPAGSGGGTTTSSTPATIRQSGSTYALRSTVTTDPARTVLWIGSTAPAIGGGYAIAGTDLWIQG